MASHKKKICCSSVNDQPRSCNPCCMNLLSGVRAVAVTDIVVSIVLVAVVLIVIIINDLSLFWELRTILFFIFGLGSLIASIFVLIWVKKHSWPCLFWAIVNGFRIVIDLVYYFVMVADYKAKKGNMGFALPTWIFILFTFLFLIFLVLYIWFVIIMLAYASYLNRKSLLENQALAFQRANEDAELRREACTATPSPSTNCSTYCSPYPCSSACRSSTYTPQYPCSSSSAYQSSTYTSSFYSSPRSRNNNMYSWQPPPRYDYKPGADADC